jgi:hypothetical protein
MGTTVPFHIDGHPHTDQRLGRGVALHFDEDENTEPSSNAGSTELKNTVPSGTISRFLESTRRRMSTGQSFEDDAGISDGALICGYLHKLGRNGKWQTRWFETDGECLSYYKNNKRTKLMATLDLDKVRICIDKDKNKTTKREAVGCRLISQSSFMTGWWY